MATDITLYDVSVRGSLMFAGTPFLSAFIETTSNTGIRKNFVFEGGGGRASEHFPTETEIEITVPRLNDTRRPFSSTRDEAIRTYEL